MIFYFTFTYRRFSACDTTHGYVAYVTDKIGCEIRFWVLIFPIMPGLTGFVGGGFYFARTKWNVRLIHLHAAYMLDS